MLFFVFYITLCVQEENVSNNVNTNHTTETLNGDDSVEDAFMDDDDFDDDALQVTDSVIKIVTINYLKVASGFEFNIYAFGSSYCSMISICNYLA